MGNLFLKVCATSVQIALIAMLLFDVTIIAMYPRKVVTELLHKLGGPPPVECYMEPRLYRTYFEIRCQIRHYHPPANGIVIHEA